MLWNMSGANGRESGILSRQSGEHVGHQLGLLNSLELKNQSRGQTRLTNSVPGQFEEKAVVSTSTFNYYKMFEIMM